MHKWIKWPKGKTLLMWDPPHKPWQVSHVNECNSCCALFVMHFHFLFCKYEMNSSGHIWEKKYCNTSHSTAWIQMFVFWSVGFMITLALSFINSNLKLLMDVLAQREILFDHWCCFDVWPSAVCTHLLHFFRDKYLNERTTIIVFYF